MARFGQGGQDRWLLVMESEEEFRDVMRELHDGMVCASPPPVSPLPVLPV